MKRKLLSFLTKAKYPTSSAGLTVVTRQGGKIRRATTSTAGTNSKNTLEEPDKWEPGSAAAQVYAHFKQHGAVNVSETGSDRIAQFDPLIEQAEFDRGCKDEDALKRSPQFAKVCQSRKY